MSGKSSSPRSAHEDPGSSKRRANAPTKPSNSPRNSTNSQRRVVEEEDRNEQSPLLHPSDSEDDSEADVNSPLGSDEWQLHKGEETKTLGYLILLTVGQIGLQIGWGVETSYGSPFLLSLGISKSLLSLVWLAGPLSGVIVQPYVGIKSDRCRMRWGKRRPFIVGGCIATVLSLLSLSWSREIVGGFLGLFGADRESSGVKTSVAVFAVIFVYVLDFAINTLQAGLRAYIVDCAPTHQQDTANAWASRLNGVGNIACFLAGGADLPKIFPFLGKTQFQVLCAIAALVIALTNILSCATVHERDPRLDGEPPDREDGLLHILADLFRAFRRLPPQIEKICLVQFMAWLAWFPFLFYVTTYIGEIYVEPYLQADPHMDPEKVEELWVRGTRVGTDALLVFALMTLLASIFLPFIIAPAFITPDPSGNGRASTALTPTTSISGSGHLKPQSKKWSAVRRVLNTWETRIQIDSLTLRRTWLLSHFVYAALMWLTILARNVTFAKIIIGAVGIPWAVTMWAPFALIASEVSKRDAIRRGLIKPPPTVEGNLLASGEDGAVDQAGVILGIHNVAVSAPQVLATLICSLIFKLLQKPRGTPGDTSVAWALRFGGLCAVAAGMLTFRVGESAEGVRSNR
ncbi:MFS general substrate transporter [Eremomyces bilateralis CBS 781.70]|uniref:MFS general substrate transporter n=1 Tax=Eremomyces bilateralis CBS 781.70 TaxID=1392243 RepID=A0A6G1G2P6_9PEZI|nr:MFS general substrate transporter [Eremomyces bilateralis CBS 781.70]KAF1812079.1 MFS general substrate transporter [Eremomyces bilateralis CBS 781.70]